MLIRWIFTESNKDNAEDVTMKQRTILNLLVVAALVFFVVGVTAPIMTISKMLVFDNTFSIAGGVRTLFGAGEWLLAIIIGAFSLLLPLVKIALIVCVTNLPRSASGDRWTEALEYIGKWSMLDVFVVAVLLASIKLGTIVTVEIHYGLHAFAVSVLCSMVALFLLERRRRMRLASGKTQKKRNARFHV